MRTARGLTEGSLYVDQQQYGPNEGTLQALRYVMNVITVTVVLGNEYLYYSEPLNHPLYRREKSLCKHNTDVQCISYMGY